MTFDESVAWLSGLKRYGIKLGLDRFHELLRRAGDPHRNLKTAHIAGTNGKGSTATMIACAAQDAGLKTGLYLSPYVFDLRERVQIDGQMIGRDAFARLATDARRLVEELEPTVFGQATEFEVKTLIGFWHFAESGVDFASVEVGLGGRLDATNALVPLVSVITNIFYDHMDKLGDTLGQIAYEKAGIIKPGVPVVTGALEPEALEVIRNRAAEFESPLTEVLPGDGVPNARQVFWGPGPQPDSIRISAPGRSWDDLMPRLRGGFQAANAGCAAGALIELAKAGFPISPANIANGIERAWLPGRLQILTENPTVIADGAHNPAGAAEVARFVSTHYGGRQIVLVVGMMSSHEPDEVLSHLAPIASDIIATEPPGPGQHPAEVIAGHAATYSENLLVEADPVRAVEMARQFAGDEGVVCVTGSFYLVGALPHD